MSYDSFYGDLSTRGTANEALGQITVLKDQVVILATEAEVSAGNSEGFATTSGIKATEAAASAASALSSKNAAKTSEVNAGFSAQQADVALVATSRFCGVSAIAPSTRLDGSELQEADEYQNSEDHLRYSWTGTLWVSLNSSAQDLEQRLSSVDGAGLVGFNPSAEYPVNSIGRSLRDLPEVVTDAADRAEAAAALALSLSGIYTDTAAGLAATTSDQVFGVPVANDLSSVILYENLAGVAVDTGARLPSTEGVKELLGGIELLGADKVAVTVLGREPIATFSAPGEDSLLYELMSFFNDGTMTSGPLESFVSGRLAGVEYSQVISPDRAIVHAMIGPDGILYEIGGYDASGKPLNGAPPVDPVEPPVNARLIHFVLFGQSNMNGDQALPVLSTAATGWGNYRFQRGVATWSASDNPSTPASRSESGFSLVDLTAVGVESRANGLADAYKARIENASRFSPRDHTVGPHILTSYAGIGGRRLTDLGPVDSGATDPGNTVAAPGGYWPTMLDDMRRAKAKATAAGMSYEVPCWLYDQGEREGDGKLYETGPVLANSVLIPQYKALALDMVSQFDAAARAINTTQTRPVPLFVTPACSNLSTPSAWLEASDDSQLVFMVGPRYFAPSAVNSPSGSGSSQTWGDSVHITSDGQRWVGEQCSKVIHRTLNEGEDWQPLRALKVVKVDSTHVDVVLNVPRGPLVIDTDLMIKCRGWGFLLVPGGSIDGVSGLIAAAGIEIRPDGRTLRLTFPSIPVGALLRIGADSVADPAITYAAGAVGVGANSANGFSTYTVTVAGDVRANLAPLYREGAFYMYSGTTARGIIRSVTFDGSNTVLTGENRDLRTGGTYGPFVPGNPLTFGRFAGYTNIRDSDNASALNAFVSDPRAGQLYPLHNWLCQYIGLPVIGA